MQNTGARPRESALQIPFRAYPSVLRLGWLNTIFRVRVEGDAAFPESAEQIPKGLVMVRAAFANNNEVVSDVEELRLALQWYHLLLCQKCLVLRLFHSSALCISFCSLFLRR